MCGLREMRTSCAFTRSPILRPARTQSPPWEWKNLQVSCAGWRMPSMAEEGVLTLHGVVQHYDWGGHNFIPDLLGAENATRRPFAELWICGHPKEPSLGELG